LRTGNPGPKANLSQCELSAGIGYHTEKTVLAEEILKHNAENRPLNAAPLSLCEIKKKIVAAIRDAAGNMDYVTKDYWVGTTEYTEDTEKEYEYDAAGCLTNLNGTSLEWDERYRLKKVDGRLLSEDSITSSVAYEYDVLGRRVSRIEDGVTNFFIYDGNQVVADLDGDGDILRSYVWGQGIDNLLSFTDHTSSSTYYAIKDHQNTVLAMADASGAVVESYEYDAYGNTTILDTSGNELSESAIGNRYMFQGREYDSSTGLYYFRSRWYDPDSGRWLSKDLIGIEGGLNQYEFCGNNPVNNIDPDGKAWSWIAAGAGAIAGAIINGLATLTEAAITGDTISMTDLGASMANGAFAGAVLGGTFGDPTAVLAITIIAGVGGGTVSGLLKKGQYRE
jgi:RHS repeat-associated protein